MENTYIPYGRQNIDQKDINAVIDVLNSDWLTQGPITPKFEQAVAHYCQAMHGIATNSATSALHLACLALGIGEGDIVWTSPISFVASANCALYCGAVVDFVDVSPDTGLISIERLTEKLITAQKNGALPKVLIPVHLCGHVCDMEAINSLAKKYKFKVIEDASHAIGGRYENLPVGNCRYSDITIFSFHPVKIITSGEGGMALTNDAELSKILALYRSHGITKEKELMENTSHGDWYYEQQVLGFNYRMTDIHAALGLSQLSRIDDFVTSRNHLARQYIDKLNQVPDIQSVLPDSNCYSAFHLFSILVKDNAARGRAFKQLRSHNIGVNVHYMPIVIQPYYQHLGFSIEDYPGAQSFYSRAITLPLFPELTIEQLEFVTQTLLTAV